jgi:hypothetical protein
MDLCRESQGDPEYNPVAYFRYRYRPSLSRSHFAARFGYIDCHSDVWAHCTSFAS